MSTTVTISSLTALSSVQSDDILPIVDVHDTTQAPSGSTKKITVATLLAGYLPLSGGTLTGGLTGTTATFSGVVAGSAGQFGALPASVGAVRIPNNVSVASRNAANSGDIVLIYADASNQVNLGTGNTVLLNGSTQIAGPLTFDTDGGRDIGNASTNRPRNVNIAGALNVAGAVAHTGTTAGFFNTTPKSRPSVSGGKAGADSVALQLLTALGDVVGLGLIHDATT